MGVRPWVRLWGPGGVAMNGCANPSNRLITPRKRVGGTWQAASICSVRRWNRGAIDGLLPSDDILWKALIRNVLDPIKRA